MGRFRSGLVGLSALIVVTMLGFAQSGLGTEPVASALPDGNQGAEPNPMSTSRAHCLSRRSACERRIAAAPTRAVAPTPAPVEQAAAPVEQAVVPTPPVPPAPAGCGAPEGDAVVP